MKSLNVKSALLYLVLPLIAVLAYPPRTLGAGVGVILFAVLLFGVLAFFLYKGYSRALTLAIFIQGLNVIIRIMMFFPHTISRTGDVNYLYMVLSLAAMALSTYLLLRLDRADIRSLMVA